MRTYLISFFFFLALWSLCGDAPRAQAGDTLRQGSVPASGMVRSSPGIPSQGMSRVRRRIRQIRSTGNPSVILYPVVIREAAPVVASPDGRRVEVATPADIGRLEAEVRRLHQRFDRLSSEMRRRDDQRASGSRASQVIVLPDEADRGRVQTLLDSLSALLGRPAPVVVAPAPEAEGRTPEREEAPSVGPPLLPEVPPTPEQVEDALFETGVFRALHVHFAFDESTLLPSAYATLEAVAAVLVRHPSLRIEVAGHTDGRGTSAYNQRLSEARAAAVRDYLIRRTGADPARIEARGYGESRPILLDAAETGRVINRRVEFIVRGR